jgi:hypothetical protein
VTLRRTEVGPFTIEEAAPPERFALLKEEEVLDRL